MRRLRVTLAYQHKPPDTFTEAQAEFDPPSTIHSIISALTTCGYVVFECEVSGPPMKWLDTIRRQKPNLIFNIAEGSRGRTREAMYPTLYEAAGIPYTGSDAYALTITLDKWLTKRVLMKLLPPGHMPRFAKDMLITRVDQNPLEELELPLIVKPNFEGSSKGISQDSVVRTTADLRKQIEIGLKKYPEGLLVEQFINGSDVTVPYVERYGVLTPVEMVMPGSIYSYNLKHVTCEDVEALPIDGITTERTAMMRTAKAIIDVLRIWDIGRVDFRRGCNGELFFLEVNALPCLELSVFGSRNATKPVGPLGVFTAAAARAGLNYADVLKAIVDTALARQRGGAWRK